MIHHLAPTAEMQQLAQQCFGYKGKKYQIRLADTYHPQNYWDGGSKRDAKLVSREGLRFTSASHDAKNPFTSIAHDRFEIPVGHFVIEHEISCGKDVGIHFYVRSDEMDTAMLPASTDELSRDETIVLWVTLSLKSSYGGVKDFRMHSARQDTGISSAAYQSAKQLLIDKGYLNKAGAATVKAKNYRSQLPNSLHQLK